MEYKIGEFSKVVNIPIDTLRYYEKEKLIIPGRNSVNLRIYTDNDIVWVDFLKRLKMTGMSIKKMKEYSALRYEGNSTIEKRMTLLYDQLDILLKQKSDIESHISFLNDKLNTYKSMLK